MTNDQLRAALQAIHDRHGRLDPHHVVTEAADQAHPLHRYFTWDDSTAAAAHRIEQARGLIRRVRIEIRTDPDHEPIRARAFVSVDPVGEQHSRAYLPLAVVAESEELRQRVEQEMRRDLLRLQRKYRAHEQAFAELLRRLADEHNAA